MLESFTCHACIGCGGKNLKPVIVPEVVEVVPHAIAGVAGAAPPIDAHENHGVANAPPSLHKTTKLLAGAPVEVVEEGEDVVEGGESKFRTFHAGEGGHPVGRLNYSTQELEHMLESIHEYLPISGTEWDLVADCVPVSSRRREDY